MVASLCLCGRFGPLHEQDTPYQEPSAPNTIRCSTCTNTGTHSKRGLLHAASQTSDPYTLPAAPLPSGLNNDQYSNLIFQMELWYHMPRTYLKKTCKPTSTPQLMGAQRLLPAQPAPSAPAPSCPTQLWPNPVWRSPCAPLAAKSL